MVDVTPELLSSVPVPPFRPREPGPDECCGRGCEPCVIDVYDRKYQRWQDKVEEWRDSTGLDDSVSDAILASYQARWDEEDRIRKQQQREQAEKDKDKDKDKDKEKEKELINPQHQQQQQQQQQDSEPNLSSNMNEALAAVPTPATIGVSGSARNLCEGCDCGRADMLSNQNPTSAETPTHTLPQTSTASSSETLLSQPAIAESSAPPTPVSPRLTHIEPASAGSGIAETDPSVSTTSFSSSPVVMFLLSHASTFMFHATLYVLLTVTCVLVGLSYYTSVAVAAAGTIFIHHHITHHNTTTGAGTEPGSIYLRTSTPDSPSIQPPMKMTWTWWIPVWLRNLTSQEHEKVA